MNLKLQSLFDMQNELDRRIERDRGLENEDLVDKKILALQVELGELANETRCFKFWSSKAPSEKSVILEEFVDGLHFLLSLGIILPYDVPQQMQVPELVEENLVNAFLKVYEDLTILKNNRDDVNNYVTLMEDYLMIGRLLGFTSEEINEAYLSKNQVNHTRQDQGY
ncbi:dUTP diphosphatase [Pseudalkalibacillus sp. SCS-8]|uniref:dUTP diphosphatase n=1 Tax=Pseudalkalibacillus nanhaiensis TaxID=3115291 RepID=UPI0032DA3D5F